MHRFVIALLAVLAAASVVKSQGIAARSTAETLRGLHGVHVIVEEIAPEVQKAGLTPGGIKSAVEDHLVKRGVRVLGLGELTMDPRAPTLLIRLDFASADPVYFYSSQVQFFQNVSVDMGEGEVTSYASASTWQTSKVDKAGKFRLPTLSQEVVRQVDQFVEAYLSMNEPVMTEEESPEGEAVPEEGTAAEQKEQ